MHGIVSFILLYYNRRSREEVLYQQEIKNINRSGMWRDLAALQVERKKIKYSKFVLLCAIT